MLAISVAFVASGVASAQPWSETIHAAEAVPTTVVHTSPPDVFTTSAPAGGEHIDDPQVSSLDVPGSPPSDAENHGDVVSAAAHENKGQGAGCEISSVARSDDGKDDNGKGEPSETTVGACKDEIDSTSNAETTTTTLEKVKGKSDDAKGKSDDAKGKDKDE